MSGQEKPEGAAASREPIVSARLVRQAPLLLGLFATFFVFAAQYAAVARIFLPNQIEQLDPVNKVTSLALVATMTSIGILIITPLVGAVSDRTRTRWGRRAPFILGGAVIGCALVALIPHATTVLGVLVLWVTAAIFLNTMDAPLTTIIADRFPPEGRGTASGFMGAGLTSGLTAGTIVAAALASNLKVGYAAFAATLLVVTVIFLLVNREPSALEAPRQPFDLRRFLAGFWVDPRRHPDFAWAFAGRFVMFLGYTSVVGYTLYTLRDYLGLDVDRSNREVAVIFTIELFTGIAAGLICGRLSDVWKRRKPFVFFSSVAMAVAFAVPILMPSLTGMYIFAVILGAGYGAYYAVDMALMTDVLPKTEFEENGKNLGILSVAITLPQIFGTAAAAAILTASDSDYRALFGFGAILVLASSFLVFPIRSTD